MEAFFDQPLELADGRTVSMRFRRPTAEILASTDDRTGLIQWPSATLLAELICKLAASSPSFPIKGSSCLELGCGAGLLGTVAAALCATEVCLTDQDTEALELSRFNVHKAAEAVAAALQEGDGGSMPAAAAAAGASEGSSSPAISLDHFTFHNLAWGDSSSEAAVAADHREPFDFVLASETFYIHRGSGDILDSARAMLGTAARLVRGEEGCACCRGKRAAMLQAAREKAGMWTEKTAQMHRGGQSAAAVKAAADLEEGRAFLTPAAGVQGDSLSSVAEQGGGAGGSSAALCACMGRLVWKGQKRTARCPRCSQVDSVSDAGETTGAAAISSASLADSTTTASPSSSSSSEPLPWGSKPPGVVLVVYSPRYRAMGPQVRQAAAEAGFFFRTIHRNSVRTPQQRKDFAFSDARLCCMSTCEKRLELLAEELELEEGGTSDDEDRFNEEETAESFLGGFGGGMEEDD